MSRAMSLHIGVWHPDRCDELGELSGPKADAFAMAAIAGHHGFESHVLNGSEATPEELKVRIGHVITTLDPDGTFFLTFSGHGTQSDDGVTQTWCMATRKVTDEQLFEMLADFPDTTRIIIVSASCHSAGIAREFMKHLRKALAWLMGLVGHDQDTEPELPDAPPVPQLVTGPSVLVLASCGAGETSEDGTPLSLFTEVLWETWDDGRFAGNNEAFLAAIQGKFLGKGQMPTSRRCGTPFNWDAALPFAP